MEEENVSTLTVLPLNVMKHTSERIPEGGRGVTFEVLPFLEKTKKESDIGWWIVNWHGLYIVNSIGVYIKNFPTYLFVVLTLVTTPHSIVDLTIDFLPYYSTCTLFTLFLLRLVSYTLSKRFSILDCTMFYIHNVSRYIINLNYTVVLFWQKTKSISTYTTLLHLLPGSL